MKARDCKSRIVGSNPTTISAISSKAMKRIDYIENRLDKIWLNFISDTQSAIIAHTLQSETPENLNKYYKKESFNLIQEMRSDVS